jgi:hypothetical protein
MSKPGKKLNLIDFLCLILVVAGACGLPQDLNKKTDRLVLDMTLVAIGAIAWMATYNARKPLREVRRMNEEANRAPGSQAPGKGPLQAGGRHDYAGRVQNGAWREIEQTAGSGRRGVGAVEGRRNSTEAIGSVRDDFTDSTQENGKKDHRPPHHRPPSIR